MIALIRLRKMLIKCIYCKYTKFNQINHRCEVLVCIKANKELYNIPESHLLDYVGRMQNQNSSKHACLADAASYKSRTQLLSLATLERMRLKRLNHSTDLKNGYKFQPISL